MVQLLTQLIKNIWKFFESLQSCSFMTNLPKLGCSLQSLLKSVQPSHRSASLGMKALLAFPLIFTLSVLVFVRAELVLTYAVSCHWVALGLHLSLEVRRIFKKIFLKDFSYIYKKRGREGERECETSMCGCLSHSPNWQPGLQPRHVP